MKIYGWAAHHCKMGDIELEYTARAKADYTYDPGCYRTANGDGWPPSEDYDDLEFEIDEVRAYDEDGNDIEVTEEMIAFCEHDSEFLDECDVTWDDPEPEPDYEPEEPEEW